MKLSAKKIISILPFDDEFKTHMLSGYDSFDKGTKFSIDQILWVTYDAYVDSRFQENLSIAMAEFEDGKIQPESDFYRKVRQKTEEEIQNGAREVSEKVDLTSAREKLGEIINSSPHTPSDHATTPQE